METLDKIKDIIEKMSIDTKKVFDKGNHSASIRARAYAQELKEILPIYRKEILTEIKKNNKKQKKQVQYGN
jgi:hypothetical protein